MDGNKYDCGYVRVCLYLCARVLLGCSGQIAASKKVAKLNYCHTNTNNEYVNIGAIEKIEGFDYSISFPHAFMKVRTRGRMEFKELHQIATLRKQVRAYNMDGLNGCTKMIHFISHYAAVPFQ